MVAFLLFFILILGLSDVHRGRSVCMYSWIGFVVDIARRNCKTVLIFEYSYSMCCLNISCLTIRVFEG